MLLLSEGFMSRIMSGFHRLFFISAFLIIVVGAGAQDSEVDYDQRIVQVLEGYQEIMSVPLDADVEDPSGTSWYIASQAINKGYLRFTVDPVTDSLLNGARFTADPTTEVTHIVVTQNLLDVWATYPSLTYSVLTRAFRDAETFFRDPPSWGRAQNSILELTLLRLDQYTVEAMLIRDRLLPMGYLLSPYEAFLLDSFEKDGLVGALMFLERQSLPVAQGLLEAGLAFEDNVVGDELGTFITDLGEALLESRDGIASGAADEEVYPSAVSIHTWLEMTPVLISRIYNRDLQDDPLNFEEVLEREPVYTELRRLMEASRTKDMPLLNYVYKETIKGFEGR